MIKANTIGLLIRRSQVQILPGAPNNIMTYGYIPWVIFYFLVIYPTPIPPLAGLIGITGDLVAWVIVYQLRRFACPAPFVS